MPCLLVVSLVKHVQAWRCTWSNIAGDSSKMECTTEAQRKYDTQFEIFATRHESKPCITLAFVVDSTDRSTRKSEFVQ